MPATISEYNLADTLQKTNIPQELLLTAKGHYIP